MDSVNAAAEQAGEAGGAADARPAPPDDSASEMSRIREILFGAQLRAVDERFGALEERFAQELTALESRTQRRQQELDERLRATIEELRAHVAADTDRLDHMLAGLADELRRVDWRQQEHGAMLRARLEAVRTDFQQALAGSIGELGREDAAAREALRAELAAKLAGLEEASVERRKLAESLEAIAQGLRLGSAGAFR
jgi:hypothetical protein